MKLYECKFCNYTTIHKGKFSRHLKTKKHERLSEYNSRDISNVSKNVSNVSKMYPTYPKCIQCIQKCIHYLSMRVL